MTKIKILFISICMLVVCNLEAQTREERRSQRAAEEAKIEQQVKAKVESGKIRIEIDKIVPMRLEARNTFDGYNITISKDTINCYFPYLGQSTSPSYGATLSINLDEHIVETSKTYDEKRGFTIKFRAKDKENSSVYDFIVHILQNGVTTISINITDKDPISYYGQLVLEEEKNNKK